MPNVIITAEAHALIRRNTRPGYTFRDTSTVLPDGTHNVPLSDDVVERLVELAFPGESASDVIVRTFSTKNH